MSAITPLWILRMARALEHSCPMEFLGYIFTLFRIIKRFDSVVKTGAVTTTVAQRGTS
jgi:hypothetical protein